MSGGSANINVLPSKEGASHNMKVDVLTTARNSRSDGFKYTYDFGLRRAGDHLIDVKRDSLMWTEPKDIELTLECTAVGDQIIDYIDIKVDQSSDEHSAQILSGGIGQKYVKVLVRAGDTYWFKYDARFYGASNFAHVTLTKE